MPVISQDFGEALLKKFGILHFVSTPKEKPNYTIEMWTIEFLMDTLYVITVNGEVKAWSDTHSIFGWYQIDDDYNCVTIRALK